MKFREINENIWGEVIYAYSRKNAIDDGYLVDVTQTAKESGIVFPVALTKAVWNTYVEVPESVTCQDEKGRLWDLLWMYRCEFLRLKKNGELKETYFFELYVQNTNEKPELIKLKGMIHPGDNGEGVITIMLPDED
jgi:hypothetical protein